TMYWDGSAWVEVGDLTSYLESKAVDLVFDGEILWIAFQSADKVIVAYWDVDHWTQLGNGIVDEDTSDAPAQIRLAVQDGIPVVAYKHVSSLGESPASAFRWDPGGTAWEELGDLDPSMTTMSGVVIASDGTVVVSHTEAGSGVFWNPKVMEYNELTTNWDPIGMWDGDWNLKTDHVRMTIDSQDNLYIVVQENVWLTQDWVSWNAVGLAPFGKIPDGFDEVADVKVREVGGERIIYVAYPDDDDAGDDTSLSAFILR
ncbi:MAG: hypothetical protein JRJ84_21580, partial [Deltaproteobacteria bacterium]|nr:hypothetical protein [Deltaproteobacteria bacterium]